MATTKLPPVVYAPTISDDQGANRLRMHRLKDGRVALFVYSAPDRFEDEYGEGHPWVLLTVADLQRAHDSAPYDLLMVDRELYPDEEASDG